MTTSSRSSRIALLASAAAVVLWAGKTAAIAAAGGLDKSPLEGPLFLAGLVALLTAASALGVTLTRRRATWVRVGAGILGPMVGMAVAMGIDGVVGLFMAAGEDRPWVWTEFNLWVISALALALALRARATVTGATTLAGTTFSH